jgi:sugar-phosphatase
VVARSQGRRDEDVIRDFLPHAPVGPEVRRIEEFDVREAASVKPLPGARDLVDALAPDSWAVVTSGSRRVATARLAGAGLPEPACLVTAECVQQGKPSPEGYLIAMERLGVTPERCLVVEDAPAGYEAARAAGMRCLGVGALMADQPGVVGLVPDLGRTRLTAGEDGISIHPGASPVNSAPVFGATGRRNVGSESLKNPDGKVGSNCSKNR